jgi:hypothetical protein
MALRALLKQVLATTPFQPAMLGAPYGTSPVVTQTFSGSAEVDFVGCNRNALHRMVCAVPSGTFAIRRAALRFEHALLGAAGYGLAGTTLSRSVGDHDLVCLIRDGDFVINAANCSFNSINVYNLANCWKDMKSTSCCRESDPL